MAIEKKEQSEWLTVQSVYDKNLFTIIPAERPDFILTRNSANFQLGIEVTRLFFHDASARLKYKQQYTEQVLRGNIIPKDKKYLRTDRIILLGQKDENGNNIELDVVAYHHPPLENYLNKLKERIEDKVLKYTYLKLARERLELIRQDEENFFSSWSLEELSSNIFRDIALVLLIQTSLFDEIFLITNINTVQKYIPLKKICLPTELEWQPTTSTQK